MNVNKININQQESSYYIASDIYDVSARNNNATFESLQSLLNSDNLSTLIPTAVRCGGMSIRFIQSSDNKYVQYRLMTNDFSTTVSDWQGVDEVPTVGSNNIVKSGGVFSSISSEIANSLQIVEVENDTCYQFSDNTVSEKKSFNGIASAVIEVTLGDKFVTHSKGGSSARAYYITDENNQILEMPSSNADYFSKPKVIEITQENAKYLYINHYRYNMDYLGQVTIKSNMYSAFIEQIISELTDKTVTTEKLDGILDLLHKISFVNTNYIVASETATVDLNDVFFQGKISIIGGDLNFVSNKPDEYTGGSLILITTGPNESEKLKGGSVQFILTRDNDDIWKRRSWGEPVKYNDWVKICGKKSITEDKLADNISKKINNIQIIEVENGTCYQFSDNTVSEKITFGDIASAVIEVTLGDKFITHSKGGSLARAYYITDENNQILEMSENGADYFSKPKVIEITQENAKYLYINHYRYTTDYLGQITVKANMYSAFIEQIISELVPTSNKKELEDFHFPKYIFSSINSVVLNNTYGHENEVRARNYVNTLYADRLYKNSDAVFFGKKAIQILSDHTRWKYTLDIVSHQTINLTIGSNNIKDTNFSFDLITTKNEVAIGKTITCMSIGDSITAGDLAFWDEKGKYRGSWAYWNFVHSLFLMDNMDYNKKNELIGNNINYIPVGIVSEDYPYILEYMGENITQSNDYCEGRSGWSLSSYIRHPLNTTGNSGAEGFYDILGLKTAYGAWTGTTEQKYLIGSTCWGEFQPDITEASWDLFKSKIGLSSITFNNATDEQKQRLLTWATETIVENPENPFFGNIIKTDSLSGRKYSFSWDSYYARYKTHEDDGLTELSTKGTNYKENSLVCVPKFITICLGTNDTTISSTENIVADLKLLANILKESTGAKILIIKNGDTLSQIPQYFKNTSQFAKSIPQKHYDMHKLLSEYYGTLENQEANGVFYMPSFFVQGYGTSADHRVESWNGESEYDYTTCNDIHPSVFANKQIGYQMYSMILYLLSQEN